MRSSTLVRIVSIILFISLIAVLTRCSKSVDKSEKTVEDDVYTKYTAEAKDVFTSNTGLGYTEGQWQIVASRYSDEIKSLVHIVIEADNPENQGTHDWLVSRFEDSNNFFTLMLDYYARQAGLVPPGSMEGRIVTALDKLKYIKDSIVDITTGSDLTIYDIYPNVTFSTKEIETRLTSIIEKLGKMKKEGWDTDAGLKWSFEAQDELYDFASSCGDPAIRSLLYSIMYELGLVVPEAWKDAAKINEVDLQWSYFAKYVEDLHEYIEKKK